jgi:hypothetical protein
LFFIPLFLIVLYLQVTINVFFLILWKLIYIYRVTEVQRKESAPPARAIPEPPEVPLQIFDFEGQFIQVVVNQDPPAPPAPPALGKDFKKILFSSF